jgi:hypothetical protein
MQILYTGAPEQNSPQLDPGLSLGGFVSNSLVANDTLSNIFSSASLLSIQNKRREIKMLALKNNEGDIVTDLIFKFAKEVDSICNYKVAFVTPTVLGDGSVCFESIVNTNALPYYATFQNVINNSTFNIASLANNGYLGIWLMREFDYTSEDLKSKTCAEWLTFSQITPIPNVNMKETIEFTLDYTIGQPSVSI